MRTIRVWLGLVILPLSSASVRAGEPLPRALILAGTVYREPARNVAKELKGRVEVVFPEIQAGEVRSTSWALANLDEVLGEGKWDLIYFNFGLGDLVYRAPGMKAFRVMAKEAGGVRATTPQQYEKNLQKIVKRLKATGAKLVWANTTPLRSTPNDIFDLGSEIDYNAIAARVMTEQRVPINNTHDYVRKLIDMKRPAPHGWDPFFFDRKPLHPPIVQWIVRELAVNRVRQ